MNIKDRLLEEPFLFNLWQLPFARQKFAQLLKYADLGAARSVLDVGCGPGTNASHFAHAQYLGIDINGRYIQLARKRYHRDFLVADVTNSQVLPSSAFDFILVNSFLHHLDTSSVNRILAKLSELLSQDGYLHAIELVLPEASGLTRWLAVHDRGKYPRSLIAWRELFETSLQAVIFEPFPIRHFGYDILELVYFKGRRKP